MNRYLQVRFSPNWPNHFSQKGISIFCALLFFLLLSESTWAATYTVTSWRGDVKIKNQTPKKNVTTFTKESDVKFSKTSDYVIAKDQSGQIYSFIPKDFAKKEGDGKQCNNISCKPKLQLGAISSLFILTLNSRGNILVNNTPVKVNDRLTLDSRISFNKTSDFLIVKLESGEMVLVRPDRFEENEVLGKICVGVTCKSIQEPIEIVKRTRPAFYEQYIKPLIKP